MMSHGQVRARAIVSHEQVRTRAIVSHVLVRTRAMMSHEQVRTRVCLVLCCRGYRQARVVSDARSRRRYEQSTVDAQGTRQLRLACVVLRQ